MLASAAALAELTLTRWDSVLRKLHTASPGFIETLRNDPLIASNETVELPLPEESADLFGGLAKGLRADKQQEAAFKVYGARS